MWSQDQAHNTDWKHQIQNLLNHVDLRCVGLRYCKIVQFNNSAAVLARFSLCWACKFTPNQWIYGRNTSTFSPLWNVAKRTKKKFLGSKFLTKTLFRTVIMMLLKLACAGRKPNYRAVPQNILDNTCALLGTFA